jgi:hypothetical protein
MTPAPLVRASAWAEAVFHVLAHVDVGRLAASCHDPGWIAWAEARFGRANGRALGEDCRVIASALASHDALARAQALASLWTDAAAVRAATRCDLAELADADVADSAALRTLRTLGPAAEVLRAAAELELPLFTELEPVAIDLEAWALSLASVTRAAPQITRCRVALVRPLPRRGRVYDALIMVGAPGVAGAELAHVTWQAGHEATVREVARGRAPARSFEDVERRALGLLRSRARRVGLEDAHDRWFATLDLASLGPIPDVDDGAQ